MIAGIHPVLEALKSGVWIDKIFMRRGLSGPNIIHIRKESMARSVPVKEVPPEKLRSLGITPAQGIVALVSPIPFADLNQTIPTIFETGQMPLLVMLDGVTDVRNLGSIARSALCAGAHGLIVGGTGTAALHAEAVKASAGALLKLPVHKTLRVHDTVKLLQDSGIKVVALSEKSMQSLYEADLKVPVCFILGDEEKGISQPLLRSASEALRIPMPGNFSSLNVGHAAAVALFEAVRQRLQDT
jgi:23S rRNA (guanosine2251-2'-O)-methyltransferase